MDEFTRGELEGLRDAWRDRAKAEWGTAQSATGSSGRVTSVHFGGGGAGEPRGPAGAIGHGGRNTVFPAAVASGGGGGASQPPGYWLGYAAAKAECADALAAMLADGGHDA